MRPRINRTDRGLPLGIDLVEIKTARAFYRRHRSRLGDLFTAREMRFIRKGPGPERFAMLWAAKEAAMKSLGYPALGPRDLAALEICAGRKGNAAVAGRKLEIAFIRKKNFVVASCYALGPDR